MLAPAITDILSGSDNNYRIPDKLNLTPYPIGCNHSNNINSNTNTIMDNKSYYTRLAEQQAASTNPPRWLTFAEVAIAIARARLSLR